MNLLTMILQFALPSICKLAVRVMASLLLRMHIVHVAVESLSGVKRLFAYAAPDFRVWAHHHTLVWCNGGCCRGVLVNLSCRLRLRWLTMVYGRGHGPGVMVRIEVSPRQLGRKCWHPAGGVGLPHWFLGFCITKIFVEFSGWNDKRNVDEKWWGDR
jgi:hypothetical protein